MLAKKNDREQERKQRYTRNRQRRRPCEREPVDRAVPRQRTEHIDESASRKNYRERPQVREARDGAEIADEEDRYQRRGGENHARSRHTDFRKGRHHAERNHVRSLPEQRREKEQPCGRPGRKRAARSKYRSN